MTEIDKNVIREIEDNRKVEVVVKQDNYQEEAELDLVQVFVNMGKKKRIYAWIIILCMLVGFAAPMLMSEFADKNESVSAVLTFLYPEAAKNQDPEGELLDINYLTSSYIINNALRKTKLSVDVPLSAIANNISIETLLAEGTRQNLEVMEKQLEEGTNKDYSEVKNITYVYEGKFIVTLGNGFTTDPDGKNKKYLDGGELSSLLNNIISSYNEYFYETYLDMKLPDNNLDSIGNENLDYIERLDSIVELTDLLVEYIDDENREKYLGYRSKKDGMSLKDVRDCIQLVRDIDVDYLYSFVYYNSITKDKNSMMTRYEYQLRNEQRKLSVIEGNIENNKKLISEYKNDTINVSMQDQGVAQVSSVTTDYYNELILSQSDNYENKSSISERIANLNDKIAGFKNSGSSKEQLTFVKKELDSLTNICNTLYNLTKDHAEEIVDSEFYKNSYIDYIGAQYLGTSFFSAANIKKAVIGMVVGLVLAVVVWGADGLVTEFKRGSTENNKRKKEEGVA